MTAFSADTARHRMLCDQLLDRGVSNPRVLEAIARTPRERFVSPELFEESYADRALPIECGQTISQPLMVAMMTEALNLTGRERVLEIGTGSGYQTAVLARLCQSVYSIERYAPLAETARARLAALGFKNVAIRVGDGTLGWPEGAPFDRILITAGAEKMPEPLWRQLAEGGILVAPLGTRSEQTLFRIQRQNGEPLREELTRCRFVPLVGAAGWASE